MDGRPRWASGVLRSFVESFTWLPIRRIVGWLLCMSETIQFFRRHFPQLSGIPSGAYHWQEELFGEFVKGMQPTMHVCLPTGMGKTSVMRSEEHTSELQ